MRARRLAGSFDRRRLLRGAGGVVVALPFVEALAPRRASAQAAKKKLVLFFTPEGTQAKEFFPTGTMTDFALGNLMAPLELFKKDLILFKGVDHTSCKEVGSDHFKSMTHMLTGGGPDSIDQIVAAQKGKGSRFTSLEFAAKPRNVNEKGVMAYAGGKMVPGEYNPVKMFARMFTGGVAPTPGAGGGPSLQVQQIFARRKSVLDMVTGQFAATRALVSAADRLRLDEHLAAIRDVEKSLTTPAQATTADCASPRLTLVEGSNTGGSASFEAVTQNMIDLLVLAVSCNLTTVASLQLSNSGSGEGFGFLGVPSGSDILHGWVHNDKGNPLFPEYARKTFAWFATRYALLVSRLKALADGPGSLLDSTALVWCSHFGNGGGHTPTNVPWVIAGSAAGALKTGRFLDFTAGVQPHNRLLLGLAQAMDVRLDQIGNPKYGTTPLPGMLS